MKQALLEMLSSKKFLAMIGGVVIAVAGRYGFNIDPAVLDRIEYGVIAYVAAQGIADHGKSAVLATIADKRGLA